MLARAGFVGPHAGARVGRPGHRLRRALLLGATLSLGLGLCATAPAELRVLAVGISADSRWTELEALLEGRAKLTPGGLKFEAEALANTDVIVLAPPAAAGLEAAGERGVQRLAEAVARGSGLVVLGASTATLSLSGAYDKLLLRSPKPRDAAPALELKSAAILVRDQSHSITQCVSHLLFEKVRKTHALPGQLPGTPLAYAVDSASPPGDPSPVLWTHQTESSRVLVLTLEPRPESGALRERAALCMLVARSIEWAGGRQVTIRIPPDMPLLAEQIPLAQESRFAAFPESVGYYLGREIAPVMGFQAADWLERQDREQTEQPERVLDALAIAEGSTVADIGAGTGYFAFRMAKRVGPNGKVYATDLQEEMLSLLRMRLKKDGVKNVLPVQTTETETGLLNDSVDLALMVDVYHELSRPAVTVDAIRQSLRRGQEGVRPGRLALVEYRGEDPSVPIKSLHRTTVQQLKAELEPRGFRLVEKHEFLPHQHILVFERRELLANASQ